jgi:hypothetical protein
MENKEEQSQIGDLSASDFSYHQIWLMEENSPLENLGMLFSTMSQILALPFFGILGRATSLGLEWPKQLVRAQIYQLMLSHF